MPETYHHYDPSSHLILHRTSRSDIQKGIPVIVRGEGARVFDQEGRAYIDLDAGVTRPVHVGYGRREIADAVHDQICALPYFTPMLFATPPAIQLATELAAIAPGKIRKFLFECDGSEAVESAMKIARHHHYYQGEKTRFKVISRRGAYHGVNGIGVRALGTVLPMRQMLEPLAPGGVFAESPYCYRCAYRQTYPDCDMACARDIERLIEFEGPEQISAFIGEPIQQGFGAYAPPAEYWPMVREICSRHGILLIIDEVICGFGRTGRMFATDHFDVEPDLITMAKGITSGYVPLGAVGCTEAVMAPIDVLMHLHTYGNHPVACRAGIANLEILLRENLVARSAEMGAYFLDGLKSLARHRSVGEVRGSGLWLAIDFTTDKKTRAPFPLAHLSGMIDRARQKGVITKSMGMALEFAPPLVITRTEIDEALRVLDECIAEEEKAMGL